MKTTIRYLKQFNARLDSGWTCNLILKPRFPSVITAERLNTGDFLNHHQFNIPINSTGIIVGKWDCQSVSARKSFINVSPSIECGFLFILSKINYFSQILIAVDGINVLHNHSKGCDYNRKRIPINTVMQE